MHLADHGIAGNAAKLGRDLARGKAIGPQFFEPFDAFVSPAHFQMSSARGEHSDRIRSRVWATMVGPTHTPATDLLRDRPPHEMSYLTIETLQYGRSRAQESRAGASTCSKSECACVHIFLRRYVNRATLAAIGTRAGAC